MNRIDKKFGLDFTRKVFEGEYKVSIWPGVLALESYCWHCKTKTFFEYELTPGEFRQAEREEQYRQNLVTLAADRLERDHQCGALIHDGKDVIEDVWREIEHR